MLKVEGLCVSYGPVRAVSDVGFEVRAGEILALIGPNGAGKTTTLKAIAGVLPFTGRIEFDGAPLRPGRAEERPGQGLCLVPEGRGILARMTVHENLLMGGYPAAKAARRTRRSMPSTSVSPCCRSATPCPRACSRAANSRCSPSAARCWQSRAC